MNILNFISLLKKIRKGNKKISYLILHYTAMTSCKEALEYMCEKNNKVSTHFLVSKKGEIFYLVFTRSRLR